MKTLSLTSLNRITKLDFDKSSYANAVGGILSATHAGLGVALLNGLHLTQNMDILDDVLPVPPSICYVVRTSKETKSDAVKALINEIASEAASVVPLRVA